MRDVRPLVIAASIILFVLGAAGMTISLVALVSGQRVGGYGAVFSALALFIGILVVVVLSKDPAPKGDAVPVGGARNAHVVQFTVGQRETHDISYRWDQTWGWLTVTVDGVLVVKSLVIFSFRLVRVFEFVVGNREQHTIRIEKRRPLVGSFARPQPITAYVDGDVVATHDGAATR